MQVSDLSTFTIDPADITPVLNWYGTADRFNYEINSTASNIVNKTGMDPKYVRFNLSTIVEDSVKGRYNKIFTKYLKRQLKTI